MQTTKLDAWRDDYERWAAYWARRYSWAAVRYPFIDREDLLQAARVGILRALEEYDSGGGASWSTVSAWFIKNEIRRNCIGMTNEAPPVVDTLNVPYYADGEESESRLDMLADENAERAEETAERDNLRQTVREAVERLQNADEREIVRMCYLEGKTQAEAAERLNVAYSRIGQLFNKARVHLGRDKRLRAVWLEDNTPYYKRIGANTYNSTWTSATELAAFWRLDREDTKTALKQHEKRGV